MFFRDFLFIERALLQIYETRCIALFASVLSSQRAFVRIFRLLKTDYTKHCLSVAFKPSGLFTNWVVTSTRQITLLEIEHKKFFYPAGPCLLSDELKP